VVEEDALADPGGRMDIGLKDLGRTALEIEREVALTIGPQPVIQAVGLDRVEALEIEKGLDEALARGIALEDGGDIGLEGLADPRLGRTRAVEGAQDQRQADDVVPESGGDAVEDGGLEARLVEDRVKEEWREHRCGGIGLLGLTPQPAPEGIAEVFGPVNGDQREAAQTRTDHGWGLQCDGRPWDR
jgi:hypothetical protein